MKKMICHRHAVIVLLSIANLSLLNAQTPEKLYEKGLKALYDEKFEEATDYFNQIEVTGKSYKDSRYRLEISLLVQKAYRERPLDTFLEFRETKGKSDKFYNYWLGRILANKYLFAEAIDAWESFLGKNAFKSDEIVDETQKFLITAKKLVSYFDNADDYEIHALEAPVNTPNAELSPVYHIGSDELIFASNREDPDNDLFRIYETRSEQSGWQPPQLVPVVAPLERSQSTIQMINRDGKLFVFDNQKKGSLHYTELRQRTWLPPQLFSEYINASNMELNFFVNEQENRILFATYDKKNAMQLMETRLGTSGRWSAPSPLMINSPYNEDCPYLSPDENRLYFSSDRPNGIGGYDIYMSTLEEATGNWGEPVNLGWPINSPDDDIQFKMNPEVNSGYFVSNRIHSKGDFDIFFFWGIDKTTIQGHVYEGENKQPVTGAEIRFHPVQYPDEYFRSPLDSDGHFQTSIIAGESFIIRVINHFDTLLTTRFSIAEQTDGTVVHDFYIYPPGAQPEIAIAKTEDSTPPDLMVSPIQTDSLRIKTLTNKKPQKGKLQITRQSQILEFIYFRYGTSQLTSASEPKLAELKDYLIEHPQMKIEIAGHTDNVGSHALNMALSQKRADAAKKWLEEHGIEASRITAVGYGDTKPLASNDDEENGRELNRRIEIKEIE